MSWDAIGMARRLGSLLLVGGLGPIACAVPEPGATPGARAIEIAGSMRSPGGTAIAARLERADDREACGGCHRAITAEWSASQHRTSWSDPVFVASYAVDPQPECRQCHAPRSAGVEPEPSSVAARSGISCRSCHAREGAIAGPASGRVHGGPVDPGWGRSAACDGCHQFAFFRGTEAHPGVFDPRELMQRTLSEWSQSGSRQTCQECHMPWVVDADGRRHRSHRMRGIDDAELMAQAVRVTLRPVPASVGEGQAEGTQVEVEVRTDAIAHAFPTGDMFRMAELRVWPRDAPTRVQTVVMHRRFGPVVRTDDDGTLRVMLAEIADTRPHPGRPVRRRLHFEASPAALEWSLVHLRMPLAQARAQGVPLAQIERVVERGTVMLASDRTAPEGGARAARVSP